MCGNKSSMTVWYYQLIVCYCERNSISTDDIYGCCWLFWLGQVKHEMGWCKIDWAQTSLACFNPWQGLEQFNSLLVKCPCLSKLILYSVQCQLQDVYSLSALLDVSIKLILMHIILSLLSSTTSPAAVAILDLTTSKFVLICVIFFF